jgi:phosphoglycerol transferase
MVEGLLAIGFNGIYIDRFGYSDNAAALEVALHDLLEIAPIVSVNGRLAFFDLREAAAGQRARLGDAEITELARTTLMVDQLP